jgi:hydrogenase maturation factor
MGATPKWLLVTVLLPENKTTEKLINDIFAQMEEACKNFGITMCGGHTEVTYGLDRPIVIGQMLGEVEKDQLVTSDGAMVGDDVILTKGLGIEATSIIAREKQSELKSKYSTSFIERSKRYLTDPGISVLKDALIAKEVGGVHAMHDPTEGGVATAINELAECSKVGMEVWENSLLISSETKKLCQEYNLEPLGVISSGALIISVEPSYSNKIMDSLRQEGIKCAKIGKVVEVEKGVRINIGGKLEPLPVFESDEIAKVFGS